MHAGRSSPLLELFFDVERRFLDADLAAMAMAKYGYTSKGENDIQYLDNKRSYNSLGLFLPKLGVPERSVVSRREQ